jgi:hypothetical protein
MRQISTAALAADVDVCPCPAGGIAALASPVGGVVDVSHWLSPAQVLRGVPPGGQYR